MKLIKYQKNLLSNKYYQIKLRLLPKGTACKLACETALKECKEKAEKNELKEAACEAAYEECLEACKKK